MTLSRRSFVAGVAGASACACSVPALAQWPGGTKLPAREIPLAVGGCSLNLEDAAGIVRGLEFRTMLDEAPALETYFDQCVAAASVAFDVDVAFGFYSDQRGPNAFATPYQIIGAAGGGGEDGVVLFGETLTRNQLRQSASNAGTSLLVIIGHEYAHIRQFKERRGGRCPDIELEADFLAGWMLGRESRRAPGRRIPFHLETAARTMFALGDYEFNSASHHGTPQQRLDALLRGFAFGRQGASSSDAYSASQRG